MSLRDKILNWFKRQPMVWIPSVQIERVVTKNTKHGGSYASRECRHLAEDRLLERVERPYKGRTLAWYRFNPQTYGPTVSSEMIEWFDTLPCCPLGCPGGAQNPALCKFLQKHEK